MHSAIRHCLQPVGVPQLVPIGDDPGVLEIAMVAQVRRVNVAVLKAPVLSWVLSDLHENGVFRLIKVRVPPDEALPWAHVRQLQLPWMIRWMVYGMPAAQCRHACGSLNCGPFSRALSMMRLSIFSS